MAPKGEPFETFAQTSWTLRLENALTMPRPRHKVVQADAWFETLAQAYWTLRLETVPL